MKMERLFELSDSITFRPRLVHRCELQCPKCGQWDSADNWTEGITSCEDCGDLKSIICPKCGEAHDGVHQYEDHIKTRKI